MPLYVSSSPRLSCVPSFGAIGSSSYHGSHNTILSENALAGDSSYTLSGADITKLAGYGSKISVAAGGSLDIYVSSLAASCSYKVYRMGYYGGSFARLVKDTTAFTATNTFATAIQLDASYSLGGSSGVQINDTWAIYDQAFTLTTSASWPSGLYVIRLSNGTQTSYVYFILTELTRRSDILCVIPDTTWQAYNTWNGYSIYTAPPAYKVDYDRPFGNSGSGSPWHFDLPILTWIESQGYDVTYCSMVDLDADTTLLCKYPVAFSMGHDEYWTQNHRAAWNLGASSGTSLGFLGANAGYKRIRYEAAHVTAGSTRAFVQYSGSRTSDPDQPNLADQFRKLSQPETNLIGQQFLGRCVASSFVCTNPTHFIYTGTGMVLNDTIPSIIGTEYDSTGVDPLRPSEHGTTPTSLQTIATSPVTDLDTGAVQNANVTYYVASGGGGVFSTGSFFWMPRLNVAGGDPSGSDTRVVKMAQNMIQRLISIGRASL